MRNKGIKFFVLIVISIITTLVILIIVLTTNNQHNIKASSKDLMAGVTPSIVGSSKPSGEFISSIADFSIDLFKHVKTKSSNALISPISVYLALAMTANGSEGNTLKEFEKVLGNKDLNISGINKYCLGLTNEMVNVKSGKLSFSNSIWYKDDETFKVNQDFIQTNADYFKSSLFQANFGSKQTVNNINEWVRINTNGLIEKMVETIDTSSLIYLFNTLYFEDVWKSGYVGNNIWPQDFFTETGRKVSAEFLFSAEFKRIKDINAIGFIKPYKSGKYSFVGLLPNKGVSLDKYLDTLTGEKFLSLIKNQISTKNQPEEKNVVGMPEFKSQFSRSLIESLMHMGLKDAFSGNASFNKMCISSKENIFINEVLQKSFIQVDRYGTKAGAATEIEYSLSGRPDLKPLLLNRPYLYAVVDNSTSLPVFIGTMYDPSKSK